MKKFLLIAALFIIQACTPNEPTLDVTIVKDQFTRQIKIFGKREEADLIGINYAHEPTGWQLYSVIEPESGKVKHQVALTKVYFAIARHNLHKAYDQDSNKLKVTKIVDAGRACINLCKLVEEVTIDLDEQTLRKHALNGYTIKVIGKTTYEVVFKISAASIQAQLAASDRYSQFKK
ncbi:MAG: hypothetical protein WCL30_03980 [Pseudomonadota bacterium]